MPLQTLTTPLLIVDRCCQGLQSLLSLNAVQVYPIMQRAYIEGSGQRWIQVVPDMERFAGKGEGGQSGGMIQREMSITFWIWFRLKQDMKDMSQQLLLQETQGFMDFSESVREAFTFTYLGTIDLTDATGNLLIEPMKYAGQTASEWYDAQKGIAFRGIRFTATYAEEWPFQPSLDNSNFTT